MLISFLPLLAPTAMFAAAVFGFWRAGTRPALVPGLAEGATLIALAVALLSLILFLTIGSGTSPLLGLHGIGLSVRLDVISLTMLLLVAFIGWVVVRFAATYMDGEPCQGAFLGWLCAALASVLLFVIAGHLVQLVAAWIATSLCLHKLLLFYPDRARARLAAWKKFLMARISDAALLGAASILWIGSGTSNIRSVGEIAVTHAAAPWVASAAVLLAAAALLKSAQFPTHGWLTEVMEVPTPVSALLHAGVVNAGGFLLIRFADVILAAPGVLAILVVIGGFTALFGGLVMLTQPAVKTSLAWSTIAQMGFMILQCGLALFPLALLHIVAHSLYKAHAFLASGMAVERVGAIRRPGPIAIPNVGAVGRAFLAALGIYLVLSLGFGLDSKSPQAIALGAILIFGVAYLLAQGLADAAPRILTRKTALYAISASLGYFALQRASEWMTADVLPPPPPPGPLEWTLIALTVATFGLVAVAQAMFPLWAYHPAAAGLRVHLSNGLYLNAVFDRLIGGPSITPSKKSDRRT